MEASTEKKTVSPEIASAIDAARNRANAGDLTGAIEDLLSVEKKTRMAEEALKTSHIVVAIAELCWEQKDLTQLNSQILLLCKRRGQLKQAVLDLVKTCMTFVDHITDKDKKIELIKTLKTVTDGKIYVEVERARITRQLARMQEMDGLLNEASATIQEVAVETFSSMDKVEKAEFLLDQVRLTLRQNDFTRMSIISGKFNKRLLDDEGMEAVRLEYYSLMAQLYHKNHNAWGLCETAQAVLKAIDYTRDEAEWKAVCESMIVYAVLSPWSNDVSDLLARYAVDKRLRDIPTAKALVDLFTTSEIIAWPLTESLQQALQRHEAFQIDPTKVGTGVEVLPGGIASRGIFGMEPTGSALSEDVLATLKYQEHLKKVPGSTGGALKAKDPSLSAPSTALKSSILLSIEEINATWWPILQKRVVQHNIRVVAKSYSRIKSVRLAEILGLNAATTEAQVSELASSKQIYVKIDRPAGVVNFMQPKAAPDVLSDWGADIDQVLNLIERTTHLIQKEYMKAALAK